MTLAVVRDFDEDERMLLQGLADQAALAIINTQLYKDAQRRLERLQALRLIDVAITSNQALHQTLDVLLEQITRQLAVDAAVILLLDAQGEVLEYAGGRGFRTQALQYTRLRLGEGFAGQAALRREVVGLPELPLEPTAFSTAPLLLREDFIAYFAAPLVVQDQLKGVVEVFHRSPLHPDAEWAAFLEALAGQAAIAIDNSGMLQALQQHNAELSEAYEATIEGWSHALDLRDKETEGHTRRVTELSLRLARALSVPEADIVHLRRGALLHDIGKMGVPDRILLKPGPLDKTEWEMMRRHPQYAYEMLLPIHYLRPALDIPYCHHEKWDGSGYPRGLKGEQIPFAARLFAVVDVWDALRSDRPYRPHWSADQAREHIHALSGTHFDPRVADVFLSLVTDEV
jgi:putative nucleotidyltransferase with HDIG domain